MIYKIVFILGAITLIASLADVLLSDKQKERLTDFTVSIWNWVDDATKVSMYERFSSPRIQNIIITVSLVIMSIFYFLGVVANTYKEFVTNPRGGAAHMIGFVLGGLLVLWLVRIVMKRLLPKILTYLGKSKNLWTYIAKLTGLNIALFATLFGSASLIGSGPVFVIAFVISILALSILLPPLLLVSFFLYIVAALIILAYVLLYPIELLLRRLAEYPSGPVVALSALATAVAGFAQLLAE